MPPDPHGPPGDLDATGKALYRKLREFMRAEGRWADSDKYVLGQTCRYEQEARIARDALPRDEHGKPVLTALGYNDQDVPHPLVKMRDAAAKSFVDGLRELGFTPRARKQLEIELGGSDGGSGKFGGAFG